MNSILNNDVLVPSMNTLLDDFFSKDLTNWSGSNFSDFESTLPAVNIRETEKDFMIELAAPGLKKDDFKIEVNDQILSISAEQEEDVEERDIAENFTRREYSYQSFCRSFNLPETANDEKIQASYKDGILSVLVAKKQVTPPKSVKAISIK